MSAFRAGLLLLVLACFLAAACAVEGFTGTVVSVTDGDTITVMDGNTAVKIRLSGIDCPELKGQPFGRAAKQFTSSLIFGKTVNVQPTGRDRYARLVADVKLPDGRCLNQELVKAGLAWHYVKYAPKDTALAGLEAKARNSRLGLWADLDTKTPPVPPWTWRKAKQPR